MPIPRCKLNPKPNLPNILFIMADQMKWSALKMYSDIGISTPSLERLASQGITYQHAITPHPLCVPARTSIMTGRYPHSTGCRRNETLMPAHETHAFQIWKDAGYTTALIGKNHCFNLPQDLALFDVRCEISHAGLPEDNQYLGSNIGNQGMEWVRPIDSINVAHRTRKNLNQNPQSPRIAYASSEYPIEDYGTSLITAQTETFLERIASGDTFTNQPAMQTNADDADQHPKPFALWVSYPDPHEPYEAPAKYTDMFPPKDVVMPPTRKAEFDENGGIDQLEDAPYQPSGKVSPAPEVNRVLHSMMGLDNDDPEHIRGVISTYHAMTRFIDDDIGKILDKLQKLNMLDNTIIVFTADHGDFMGEHNMVVKGGVFYDCLTRVPLIISYPKGNLPTGAVDDSMVNTIDILPTILELQGLANFDGINDAWATPTAQTSNKQRDEISDNINTDSTLDSNGKLRQELTRRIQGKPLPTATNAEPRIATFSEYGCGGPPVNISHLERLPKPWGYRTLIQTLWGREAQGRRKMVRTKNWKYITDPMANTTSEEDAIDAAQTTNSQDELYDLKNDPWELYNLAQDPEKAHIISKMRQHLAEWMIQTEDTEPVPLPTTISRSI